MVTYIGLYYPFIHFRDEGWLKLTALYWDGMRRIVPLGASVHDSDEVKRLVDAEFIQNKIPLDAAFQIGGPFRELINTHGDAMRAEFGVADRNMWPDDIHTQLYAPGRDTKLAYVFNEKLDPGLLSDLFDHGLVASRSDNPRWIGMHPRLAKVYMLSLAEAMAPRLGAHPLTDTTFDHVAVSGLTMERLAAALLDRPEFAVPAAANADAEREVEEAMASLAFRSVVPVDPARIPAEQIVEFRRTYAEERGLFQAELARLAGGLTYLKDVKDPHEVEQHLKTEYDKTLAPRVKALRKGLHNANIDTVESAMAVSFALPAAAAAVLTAVGLTLAPPVAAVAGLAFAAWTIQRKRKKAIDGLLKPSPEAYLYRASKLSTPKTLTKEIYAGSRAFLTNSG
ncbi:MAG TPA: DUF6236 family protein [Streptosporangiaceae bacterium]|jgi:hypothetical protein|nr:DUF6236 family protein [Streptosporangiaceae bacterium]